MRCTLQCAPKTISPSVIGANEASALTATISQMMSAMLADIVEGAHLVIITAHHQNLLIDDFADKEVADLLGHTHVPKADPVSIKYPAFFFLKYGRIGISARGKATNNRRPNVTMTTRVG